MNFKNTLRCKIDNKLTLLSEDNKKELSILITNRIISSSEWKESNKVFLFISFRNEVITDSIIEHGRIDKKKIYAPLISKKNMEFFRIDNIGRQQLIRNSYGILEPPKGLSPIIPDKDSIMLIPGVAFNKKGDRLGRGGGFYDRYLSKHRGFTKIAIGFFNQITQNIPTESWDIPMDIVITDKDFIYTGVENGSN